MATTCARIQCIGLPCSPGCRSNSSAVSPPTAFAASEVGFGGDEAAFDGGFEDGGLVAFEVGLDALEVGDGFVEAGELFFDFRDDEFLSVARRVWNGKGADISRADRRI